MGIKNEKTNALSLEDVLLFLECGSSLGLKVGGIGNLDINHFRHIEILQLDDFPTDKDTWFFKDVSLSDVGNQLDVCWIQNGMNQVDEAIDANGMTPAEWMKSKTRWMLTRVRNVPISTARGRWKLTTGKLVEIARAWIDEKARWLAMREYVELRGGLWTLLPLCNQHMPISGDFYVIPTLGAKEAGYYYEESSHHTVQVALGMAFRRQYDWRVRFTCTGAFNLYLPVLPQNLKHVFASRDRNIDNGRRSALKHWVSRYWRSLPGEKGLALQEQVQVIEHLRGREHFTWQGLEALILPSEDSVKMARSIKVAMPTPRPKRLAAKP